MIPTIQYYRYYTVLLNWETVYSRKNLLVYNDLCNRKLKWFCAKSYLMAILLFSYHHDYVLGRVEAREMRYALYDACIV